jgi:uncharacterized protein (TIGR02996 family)
MDERFGSGLISRRLSMAIRLSPWSAAMPSLRDALEAALVENPDDLAAHSAYADYLQEQGDPRGEFIQVQLALEDPDRTDSERRKLHLREQALLLKHERKWLGRFAGELLGPVDAPIEIREFYQAPYEFEFRRGWLDRLVWRQTGLKHGSQLGRLLCKAPEARLLRELVLETDDGIVKTLLHSPYLGNLRVFQLGENDEHGYGVPKVWVHSPEVPDLVARLPRIEELRLLANCYDPTRLFALRNLQQLRVLKVYRLQAVYPLELLADNPALGELSDLRLHPHASPEPLIDLTSVRALLNSSHLRSLTHLQLRCSNLGDVGCTEIVTAGILRRLKSLDLCHGEITDVGARILADCPDLRHLELLDIARNGLTQTGIDALRRVLGSALRADDQQSSDELEQQQYLAEGDRE